MSVRTLAFGGWAPHDTTGETYNASKLQGWLDGLTGKHVARGERQELELRDLKKGREKESVGKCGECLNTCEIQCTLLYMYTY